MFPSHDPFVNDKDIKFQSDDGSGGIAEYFRVDGDTLDIRFSKAILLFDNVNLKIGASSDLQIFHNATDSFIINNTGDFYISNQADNKDIIFTSDDGGGNTTTYFLLDGSLAAGGVPITRFPDNSKLGFGDSTDLQIFHDSNNSYIQDSGTGELKLLASSLAIQSASGNEYIAYFAGTGGQTASLYAGNVKKLETKSTGINIQGVTEYADNTAALAGGLTTGDVYRTGDLLKIVH